MARPGEANGGAVCTPRLAAPGQRISDVLLANSAASGFPDGADDYDQLDHCVSPVGFDRQLTTWTPEQGVRSPRRAWQGFSCGVVGSRSNVTSRHLQDVLRELSWSAVGPECHSQRHFHRRPRVANGSRRATRSSRPESCCAANRLSFERDDSLVLPGPRSWNRQCRVRRWRIDQQLTGTADCPGW